MKSIPSLREVEAVYREAITKPDARSRQVNIGASEVGACAFCCGYTLARKFYELPKRSGFGYAAWVGTGIHYWLEKKLVLPTDTLREYKVRVGHLDGYGDVFGTADIVFPSWRRVNDYKCPGEFALKKLLLAKSKDPENWTPSSQYRYQQQLLAHGLRAEGIDIDMCTIFFFPRHTNSYRSVLTFEEPYNEDMVTLAMNRLEAILEDVLEGRLDDIESDAECYACNREGRPDVTGYQELEKTQEQDEELTQTGATK